MIPPQKIKTPQGTFAAIPGDYVTRDIRPAGPDVIPGTLIVAPEKRPVSLALGLLVVGIVALALAIILD